VQYCRCTLKAVPQSRLVPIPHVTDAGHVSRRVYRLPPRCPSTVLLLLWRGWRLQIQIVRVSTGRDIEDAASAQNAKTPGNPRKT